MLLPTQADVAALLSTYTTPAVALGDDPANENTGEFTAFTTPTAEQVDALIARYGRQVYAKVGSNEVADMPDEAMRDLVKDVIALGAAAEVVRSFSQEPEVHQSMRTQYLEELAELSDAVSEAQDTGSPGSGDGLVPSSSCGIDYGCMPEY